MSAGIAIVGMACCYPDARSPRELWDNVLAQRRAFRRIPAERLSLPDYFSEDPATADSIYTSQAALIEGYQFDRPRFRVAGPIFRSVDMTHWLALDVADQALRDAGFADGAGLPRETTGVLVGNTLTGEFSRAATLRLRWPYVRRIVEARLLDERWEEKRRIEFLEELEHDYKEPFSPVGEETLAGALSNTIPGRICNYFHFGGGGYTLDGACCSSLLAVARACSALENGELDAAIAGGVDLSLDPFELVGFAKAGALAHGEMRVYDRQSSGFLPGEGSGFMVLMRAEDANAQKLRSYAVIRGWGISSDGAGSITRPEVRGQMLALERAYKQAGYGPNTVALFEGHGTGTPVGDEVELQAILAIRKTADPDNRAAIGSIKANIGHTKAAAGIAGLIKAAMAIDRQILPPATGIAEPRQELQSETASLRILDKPELWPEESPLRAGVNSFGFGGINVHVTIEGGRSDRRTTFSPHEERLLCSPQDSELFLLDGDSAAHLVENAKCLAREAEGLSLAELADVSTALAGQTEGRSWRAAVVAHTPQELAERVTALGERLRTGTTQAIDPEQNVFIGAPVSLPRIGFVFPGQASPVRLTAGIHGRRFPEIENLYEAAKLPKDKPIDSTHVAQLAIATSELAALRLMKMVGIEASVGIGHSIGEIVAYAWAGALDEASCLRLVNMRGRLMAGLPEPAGSMASVFASAEQVEELAQGEEVVLACFNAPDQTVIAGPRAAVLRVVSRAKALGRNATVLPAANAFHSPLMAPAAPQFQKEVEAIRLDALQRKVISTITGEQLHGTQDLKALMVQQLTAPVRFLQALQLTAGECDLYIEAGPGRVLTHLTRAITGVPVISLDPGGASLVGLLQAAAAAYVKGAHLNLDALFGSRFARAYKTGRKLSFFENPCEKAPIATKVAREPRAARTRHIADRKIEYAELSPADHVSQTAEYVVQSLVARRTELPRESVQPSARLLRDLHLNSIVVAEIVASAARELGLAPPARPLDFADATVGELAQALETLSKNPTGLERDAEPAPAGIDQWVRAFTMEWVECRPAKISKNSAGPGSWKIIGESGQSWISPPSIQTFPGEGVIVCVEDVERQATLLLDGAHAVLKTGQGRRYLVLVGPRVSTAGAFARTLHLENPQVLTRVIEAPSESDVSGYIRQEISTSSGHVEARYDNTGRRFEPRLKLLSGIDDAEICVRKGETLLVTGGAKGIVAACVSALAQGSSANLVILGRSRPEESVEVAEQLQKLNAKGVKAKYIAADVCDAQAVRAAVKEAELQFGPISGIVHGAGCNQPMLLRDLDEAALRSALAPKIDGLRNLISACDVEHLRLLVTFGSVIGRVGLRGESHYALANACLTSLTEDFARQHPSCRCMAFESSAWSRVGMAERLGTIEALRRDGISAIAPEEGVAGFQRLLSSNVGATSVVLTSRLGDSSPVPIQAPPLPMHRFLERPRIHYPGVELVVESDLTTASDPYLLEHMFQGHPLLPGVIGLEAMVQAAMAVAGEEKLPVIEEIRFEQPVAVEPRSRVTVRVAALVRESGLVEVALRSSLTSFALDHFRCVCRFSNLLPPTPPCLGLRDSARLPVEPERDLYGNPLFQSGRFRRLAGYLALSAHGSLAEIAPAMARSWFSQYLPQSLILGDAAARDAGIHSIQACVPHAVLLPTGVEKISAAKLDAGEKLFAHARERWQQGLDYCYDLELRNSDGEVRESWQGLMLRKVADASVHAWPDPLVAASLEWRLREAMPLEQVKTAFERDSATDRRVRSERAIQKALGSRQAVLWRSDGKPEVGSGVSVSSAHMDGLTLAVAGPHLVACDLEPVRQRGEQVWRDLLGVEGWNLAQSIAGQTGEDMQTAATRVWTALESLKKAAKEQDHMVLLPGAGQNNGCISLAAAGLKIASAVFRFRENPLPVAVSILTRSQEWSPTSTAIESALKKQIS